MDELLRKLNYRGQKRIVLINADKDFISQITAILPDVQIDSEIDPRYPYEFMLFFVRNTSEIESLAPRALHNLIMDGILWFAYPKKSSKIGPSDIDRDHGWKLLADRGFERVRVVSVDQNWSALRFRNVKFIKSSSGRFDQ